MIDWMLDTTLKVQQCKVTVACYTNVTAHTHEEKSELFLPTVFAVDDWD